MTYEPEVREVAPQLLAAVHGRANSNNLVAQIPGLFTIVWDYIHANGLKNTGHNVMLYDNTSAGFFTETGIPIQAGVQVFEEFPGDGEVVCSATPGGTVAAVTHVGPYNKLIEAHAAVRKWCLENNRALAGRDWEIYGHWTDNPEELTTEVVYLLK